MSPGNKSLQDGEEIRYVEGSAICNPKVDSNLALGIVTLPRWNCARSKELKAESQPVDPPSQTRLAGSLED